MRRGIGPTIQGARPSLGAFTLDELPSGAPAPAPKEDPNALAMVQFSSGTTVDPKPVALTHRAVLAHATHAAGAHRVKDGGADISGQPRQVFFQRDLR